MRKDFIKKFIEEEMYFQNEPLKMDKFIEFCKKRELYTNKDELEFLEKEGLFYPLIRIENPKNSIGRHDYISINFQESEKNLINELFQEDKIYDPSVRGFEPYSSFKEKSKFNEKISSYYSSFQIHWLKILKKDLKIQLTFSGPKIGIYSESFSKKPFNSKLIFIDDINDFNSKFDENKNNERFKNYFDIKTKKDNLKKDYDIFNSILEFLISIQRFYYPFGKSDSKSFFKSHDPDWNIKKNLFNPKQELKRSDLTINEIAYLYWDFSHITLGILGVRRDDWIQLWKNLDWKKKDNLEGDIRLGIEYLHWSLMLKHFLEDYYGYPIFDIDEIRNILPDTIISRKHIPRTHKIRKESYFDPKTNKNNYYNKYKRLFYLANDFKLDYQPRIMVFVEGKSEELIIPEVFEWRYAKPEHFGIDIMNFKGVDQLLSTSNDAKALKRLIDDIRAYTKGEEMVLTSDQSYRLRELIRNLEKTDIIISNWTSHISYNLEKWQTIPFFVSDNEGNVKQFLESGKPIKFEGNKYDVPKEWRYLWGINNNNNPFVGKDFEFANFNDEEITLAFQDVFKEKIDINLVKNVRKNNKGINELNKKIFEPGKKIELVRKLFENLFKKYEKEVDESLLERPIFKLIDNIIDLAILNHPPIDTEIELVNKKIILNVLSGKGYDQ